MEFSEFTLDTFTPLVGDSFTIGAEEDSVSATLKEAAKTSAAEPPEGQRQPFALLFETDEAVDVEQQIFNVTHDALGEMALFLVPLGPGEKGMQLEAVIT